MKGSGTEDEKLADMVRYMIPMVVRERHRSVIRIMIVLLSLVVLCYASGFMISVLNGGFSVRLLFWALTYGGCMWMVAGHHGHAYVITLIMAFTGASRLALQVSGSSDPLTWIMLILLACTAAWAFHAKRKLNPAWKEVKEPYSTSDGQARLRNVFRFQD